MQDLVFKVFPHSGFIDLNLFQMGRERCRPAQMFGPAARNHFLFHYVLSGKGTLYAANRNGETRTYALGANEGFLLFPDQISTYVADRDNPWEYMWLEFDGLHAKAAVTACCRTQDTPVFGFDATHAENVRNELSYMLQNKDAPFLHLLGHACLFLEYLTRQSAETSAARPSEAVRTTAHFHLKEAVSFIENNYQKDISVEEIAANCGLNRIYFGKIFKETFGKSPQDFLIQYRLHKAAELLADTALPVGEIGYAVGYRNPLHFSRAFKNRYGISPRLWREKRCNA